MQTQYQTLDEPDVESTLDDIFGPELATPTGDGLSKKEARKLLISELNKLIYAHNLRRLAYGQRFIASPLKGLRQIDQAVFMARQQGEFKTLLANCGY